MGDFFTLHEEPRRPVGIPPAGRPLPPQRPVQNTDAIHPRTSTTRYHDGPILTQQIGNPIIARHTMPSITPAAVSSDLREETLFTAEEMYDELTRWYVVRFEKVPVGKRLGWEIVKRIDVPETSSDQVVSKVRELNRTTVPVLHKLNDLDADVLDQINTVQKEVQQLFGYYFQTEVAQIEDRVWVVVKEKTSRERGRGYERDPKGSKHHHRGRHSDKRSKSRGAPVSRSRERKEERTSVTAYYKTAPKPGVDLHMLMYGRAEEPSTRPRYAYQNEVREEGHVRFQVPAQGLPQHHQQQPQHGQHSSSLPHPQHRQDHGPPQHQHQHVPPGDRQFGQTPQPPLQAPRNAPHQAGANIINRGESPGVQGRPPMPPQGYPQGLPQGHPQGHPHGHTQGYQQGKPQGDQQAHYRPPVQGQVQPRPVSLQQGHPQVQTAQGQRQTEYRGNGGPIVTVTHPPHKPGILKQHPTEQGLPQRRASLTPHFAYPPDSPSTDESLVAEVFSEDEEDYDSDTAVSEESFPENLQFAGPRKPNNVVVNNPPPQPRFTENAAHGMPPKFPRQMPVQPMMQQQQQHQKQPQQQPQQRHVVKGRRHSVSNHMATERMYAPTPPPLFPMKERPRVDVHEIEKNAYEAGRADAQEEAFKLAERLTAAAKPQIILPERSRPQSPPQVLRHQSPVPTQPVRRITLPLQTPHSGVRRVQGMEARRESFVPTSPLDRYESGMTADRRRSSFVDRDTDRRRDDGTEYVVEYGTGAYDSDVFDEEEMYEERQRGSGVYRRASPVSYAPKAEDRLRRPSVHDDRDRQYETVRVRLGADRLPRREDDPVYARDREGDRGDFVQRHDRRDSGVDVGGFRYEGLRPGLAKRTATYPARYSRDH
ncbi:uncharacterized protein PODANS_7_7160 [Podospora anserina S mat+]|uniref:Podospora anserina S mat+ genomic DNA chromosome 7, supercontig 1 n=1 Tax=Podospora anserina (strain S / ATCC MYA-4624 / DSM 980 / FGSC 10383) TaxID=515849 RepID=B2AWH2_PODAN|nr:uncharacterized protein PODANS_7_7160 [Podospora anserina S mat+]CAP68746.1 unnamed protein product [Podospora anserina S mat+]CDP32216.1 Putative protein of unknown function [Podospora anserina S mat+]